MNHSAITERFQLYVPGLRATKSRGLRFAINEGAAVLGGAPINFGGGFGYGLWAVDFSLAAMSHGVDRVENLAALENIRRSFFTPISARAPYPSAIFVADFVGKGASSIVELNTKRDLLTAYSMYDTASGKLQRIALVNLKLYNGTSSTGPRPTQAFSFTVPSGVKSVTVQRLHAKRGAAALGYDYGGPSHNVTWAGEQWSKGVDNGKGHFVQGVVKETTLQVKNGVVHITVPDSEALMIHL